MNAPVQIRNPEVAAKVREVAMRRRRSITQVIDEVFTPLVAHERKLSEAEVDERRRRAEATLARLHAMPLIGREATDDDLYDEHGLPK